MRNVMALFLPAGLSPLISVHFRPSAVQTKALWLRGDQTKESLFTTQLLNSAAFPSDCLGSDVTLHVRCKKMNGLSQNNWWTENAETQMSTSLSSVKVLQSQAVLLRFRQQKVNSIYLKSKMYVSWIHKENIVLTHIYFSSSYLSWNATIASHHGW